MPWTLKRLVENPIIYPELDDTIGTNINGPSLIRVPDWLPSPLGRYYLYFAHHQGQFIRMAYADELGGPWHTLSGGVLSLADTMFRSHIASPDVHVDDKNRRIIMYFHGVIKDGPPNQNGQRTGVALSEDGQSFEQFGASILAPFYLRVICVRDRLIGVAKSVVRDGGGVLLRTDDFLSPFTQIKTILPRQRHAALLLYGDELMVFYSRGNDSPERILVASAKTTGEPESWAFSEPETVAKPEYDYEGADLPVAPSSFGAVHERVHQLRDPAIFVEDGKVYLIYSYAGESGLAIGELIRK